MVCPVNAITRVDGAVQLNESLCVSCKLCGIACPFGAIEFSGSRPLDIPANANTPKAPPAPPAPARVSTLLDWVPGIRAIAVKCDLCSFDEQGPACVRMCPTKALHLVDNTDIARVSKRKRELTLTRTLAISPCFSRLKVERLNERNFLINSGVAWFVAAAVLAFLFSFQKALSGWIAGIGGAVGSLYTAAAGFTVLTGAVGVSGALSLVSYDVQISPLNAIWLITLGLCGLFVSLYNIDWHRHAQVKCNGLQINMLMAAAVCAVIASNLGMFVVMAEIMALCAVFLTSNSKEGKLWFALGRLGTLLLAIACWLLWQRYGTLDLRLLDMRMQQLPLGSDIWLLGVIGFGLLAGIIPLHGWVPQAHANASAPAAALFSTVVMKIGLLGILTLSLLGGNAPLWWGSHCWYSA